MANATAAISVGVFCTAAPYAASSGIAGRAGVNFKTWLPPQRVPVVDLNGLMTVPWYRFFQYVAEKRLGGATAASIPDLSTNVIAAKQEAVAAKANTSVLSGQVKTNAEALEVTRQVVVGSGLAGSVQIPAVDRTSRVGYL